MSAIQYRRDLHRIPELDRDLPQTMAYLRTRLEGLRCTLSSPIKGSLCAFFDFGAPDAVAFRADADALPITEATGLPYASQHPGRMHACGHDGHMAILLELAHRLHERAGLPQNVLLVFQPAEETTGGARDLCASGVFEQHRVRAVYGLHLWPGLKKGCIASRPGAVMCRSCEVKVDIIGRSAHIARAEEGADALAAGVAFYRRAAELEQSLSPDVPRLLKFGRMESGTVCNAVSGRTRLEGSLRAFDDGVFLTLRDGLAEIAREVEKASGCAVAVSVSEGYPPVCNPPALLERARTAADIALLPGPSMTAEDFSWYQQTMPGLFFFLGTGDTPALHAANFNFDEEILEKGAGFFMKLAETRL